MSYTAFDAVGNTLTYSVYSPTGTAYTNYYNYTYELRDGYKESVIHGTSTYFSAGNTTSTYDADGNLTKVVDQFATNKTRTFINNQAGQILRKTENSQTQNFFYANGNPVGSSGIVNSSGAVIVNPDFDYNYTPVSDRYPPLTPGAYVVAQGDTLQGIAMTLFGDASLWYLIADANGVRQDSDLIVGKTLTIPNKITNLRNSFDVHKPYQPGQIVGDITPTLPDPPPPPSSGHGCGGFGTILVAAIAVVATVVTAGAATVLMAGGALSSATLGGLATVGGFAMSGSLGAVGLAAAAIGGAVGSIVAQGVGIATGLQDKFSWNGVAMGALAAGAAAGVGSALGSAGGALADGPGAYAVAGLKTAASNVVTQGLAVATGLQNAFDWKSVAVSAIAAPVGRGAGTAAGMAAGGLGATTAGIVGSTAGTIAGGAVRQVVYGGKADFVSIAADAFGNALGNAYVEGQVAKSRQMDVPWSSQEEARAKLGVADDSLMAGREAVDFRRGIQLADAGGTMSDVGLTPTEQAMLELQNKATGPHTDYTQALRNADDEWELAPLEVSAQPEDSSGKGLFHKAADLKFTGEASTGLKMIAGVSEAFSDAIDGAMMVEAARNAEPGMDMPGDLGNSPRDMVSTNDPINGAIRRGLGLLGKMGYETGALLSDGVTGAAAYVINHATGMLPFEPTSFSSAAQSFKSGKSFWDVYIENNPISSVPISAYQTYIAAREGRLADAAESAIGLALNAAIFTGVTNTAAIGEGGTAGRQILYHYTNEAGMTGIVESNSLNPSLWRAGTKDVRYGNGQYVSDFVPGTKTPAQLSREFLGMPFQGDRFTHYIEIDATGLGAVQGRPGVYVIPNEVPLDLTGRLLGSGRVPMK